MLHALTKFKNFAFNKQCVRYIPRIRSFGELPACLFDVVSVKHKTDLIQLKLHEDQYTTSILNALENAKVFGISPCGEETNEESLVQGIAVSDVEFDEFSVQPSTIYLRHFYPALLSCLLKKRYSILTGNPGVSKSWFHWYILYHMINKNVVRNFEAPKLIVRQIARKELVFIFPHYSKAFYTTSVDLFYSLFLRYFQRDAVLILVEPKDSLTEPEVTGIQTILTCSPDRRHYKEFEKVGAAKVFMPVWTLDELQLVGAHIRCHASDEYQQKALTPEGIADRYNHFGGIIRHVIPVSEDALRSAERLQKKVLGHTKPVDIFVKGTDIEKEDNQKDNISHMLLHYEVDYEEKDFMQFNMVFASEYVKKMKEQETMSDEELQSCIVELKLMFQGGRKLNSDLFETVVFHGLSSFEWKMYCKDEQKWVDRKFEFKESQWVAKQEEKLLQNMRPSVLYRPLNPKFPLVDMLWVEINERGQKELFFVQVTFAEKHDKSMSTYENLRSALCLKPSEKLNIYFVPNPRYVDTYAKRDKESFISGATKTKKDDPATFNKIAKKLDKLEFSVIKTNKFDYPFVSVEDTLEAH